MQEIVNYGTLISMIAEDKPEVIAYMKGNEENNNLVGVAEFFRTPYGGVVVNVEVYGLPSGFHGMHIHEVGDCTIPFDKTGNHYNPQNTIHPNHAGDMPTLLGNHGYSWMAFYDERFTIDEIIGKSIIIHSMHDDFMTQPSGASGDKIGCGVIMAL